MNPQPCLSQRFTAHRVLHAAALTLAIAMSGPAFAQDPPTAGFGAVTVRLWESDSAWAAFREAL